MELFHFVHSIIATADWQVLDLVIFININPYPSEDSAKCNDTVGKMPKFSLLHENM